MMHIWLPIPCRSKKIKALCGEHIWLLSYSGSRPQSRPRGKRSRRPRLQNQVGSETKLVSCQCECLAETKAACGFLMACRCLWAQRGPGTMLTAVKVQCRGCTSVRPIHEQIIDRKLARLIQMKLRFSPRNLWKGPNSRSR